MADSPLRIGIDAREVIGETTGVGRYLGELLQRWIRRPDAAARRFILFAPAPLSLSLPGASVEVRVLPAAHGGTWWEQTALRSAVRREPLDVFFAPAYTAPLGLNVPLALTIHDVSFLAHPEWFRPRERARRAFVTRRSARGAAVVFTDSQFSRDEIVRLVPLDPARVEVIAPGISPRHRATAPAKARDPLVLFVGSVFNRRRLPQLIAGFARLAADLPAAKLVIVGSNRTWPHQDLESIARDHGVSERVDVRSYIADDELARLYARASAFVFLSEYEGFGLTPLEALAAGVPIFVLDTPVAREVYGPAAVYLPHSAGISETADMLRGALQGSAVAEAMLPAAGDVLSRYSWEDAAERTLNSIERVARSGRRPEVVR
jgi:glycosyltransferase involved in cell wall biosynthesis